AGPDLSIACRGPLDDALERQAGAVTTLGRQLDRDRGLEIARGRDLAACLLPDQDEARLGAHLEPVGEAILGEERESVLRFLAIGLVFEAAPQREGQRLAHLPRAARLDDARGGRPGARGEGERQEHAHQGAAHVHGSVTDSSSATSRAADSLRTRPTPFAYHLKSCPASSRDQSLVRTHPAYAPAGTRTDWFVATTWPMSSAWPGEDSCR